MKKIYLLPLLLVLLSSCSSDSSSNTVEEQMYFPPNDGNITWETKSKLGNQNWKLLKSEFAEWVGPWTYLSLGQFVKIFQKYNFYFYPISP